jgi:hypothetical protein
MSNLSRAADEQQKQAMNMSNSFAFLLSEPLKSY